LTITERAVKRRKGSSVLEGPLMSLRALQFRIPPKEKKIRFGASRDMPGKARVRTPAHEADFDGKRGAAQRNEN